jgi:secondary thiamine-phosphate synthase enzyme
METIELSFDTRGKVCTDLTPSARRFCAERGGDGLLSVFVPHATAGVAVFELGAGSDEDVDRTLATLLPRDDRWRHAHGSPGHGADHVLPALVSPSLTVPVIDGAPALGTWQSIVLVDTNEDNPRRTVRLSLLHGAGGAGGGGGAVGAG